MVLPRHPAPHLQTQLARRMARACRVEPSFVDEVDPWPSLEHELRKNGDVYRPRYERLRRDTSRTVTAAWAASAFVVIGTIAFLVEPFSWMPPSMTGEWFVLALPLAALSAWAAVTRPRVRFAWTAAMIVAAGAALVLFLAVKGDVVIECKCYLGDREGRSVVESPCLAAASERMTPEGRALAEAVGGLERLCAESFIRREQFWARADLDRAERIVSLLYLALGVALAGAFALGVTWVREAWVWRPVPGKERWS